MRQNQKITERIISKYERYVAPVAFIAGFVFDALTLQGADVWADNMILMGYLALVGLCIVFINVSIHSRLRFRLLNFLSSVAPFAMQFALGGLFSAFIIFYTKSAAFAQSWMFLSALAVLFVGNEILRKRYERLVFQIGIYFTALFSYSVFLVPVLVRRIGDAVFIVSGALSLVFIIVFLFFLKLIYPARVEEGINKIMLVVGAIYITFNIFYFSNIIPPAPLALKEGGIYHEVSRTALGEYELIYEEAPWYLFFQETSSIYHWRRGEPVYFWSAIFAPSEFNISIVHRWSRYNGITGEWVGLESIDFPVYGGRENGYRVYSFKTGLETGRWRVEVATDGGAVLGRYTFDIVEAQIEPELVRTVK